DLSAGVMTGSAGLTIGMLARDGWNIWFAMGAALLLALAVGFLNGYLTVRTGLPSFIVTLGSFLMLQGLNVGLTMVVTATVLVEHVDSAPGYALAYKLLSSTVRIAGAGLGALIFGMTSTGIVYLGWDADWFKFFLGAMLLLAVLANRFVRRYAERSRA